MTELLELATNFADAVISVDSGGVPFKNFRPGVGPYGEPQLLKQVVMHFNNLSRYQAAAQTKRTPDILIRGYWAIEVKIVRPFGDNGKEAENWSVNLLHPYPGNASLIGDCLKLSELTGPERKAAVAVGYEHTPPIISLAPLFSAFEVVATQSGIKLSERAQVIRLGLCHPVHQQVVVAAWEILK